MWIDLLSAYVQRKLTQNKGKDLAWVYGYSVMLTTLLAKTKKTIDILMLVKHILTASRRGSEKVRLLYIVNMILYAFLTGFMFLGWYFLRKWFFWEFQPFAYWNLNGNFWVSVFVISAPAIIYAFSLGQLDWFGSSDPFEKETLVSESLPFKWTVSFSAGLFEELTHRCITIYFGLIAVYLSNFLFGWIVAVIVLIIWGAILASAEVEGQYALPLFLAACVVIWFLRKYLLGNVILIFNGWIYKALELSTYNHWVTFGVFAFLMSIAFSATIMMVKKKHDNFEIGKPEFMVVIISFGIWTAYVLPLGISVIGDMPIMPFNADKWTRLLYVGAILWSNAKFRDGHKYQGPAGMLNSYVIGFYMFYIAFTFGLSYAIAAHFLFDAVLFSSEHLVQLIKNWHRMHKVAIG